MNVPGKITVRPATTMDALGFNWLLLSSVPGVIGFGLVHVIVGFACSTGMNVEAVTVV